MDALTSVSITLISILIAMAIAVGIMSIMVYFLLCAFHWFDTKEWRW